MLEGTLNALYPVYMNQEFNALETNNALDKLL